MTTTTAVCPGSFDPVTLGHLDVIRRARSLFDEVIVAVGINAAKSALLGADERVDLIARAVRHDPGVRAVRMDGLLADLCRDVGAVAIVKGLRSGADFDAEAPMGFMNRTLAGVETVFVLPDPRFAHVSSSMVKDIARHGGDVSALVPEGVVPAIERAGGVRASGARAQGEGER